jgi:oligopeptide transport system substrate-binding protein
LFEGLSSESPTGEIVPGTAESWSVTPDGTRYRFIIRAAARWSDGQPVTAEDYARGLRYAVDPATQSPGAELLALVQGAPAILAGRARPDSLGITVVDPRTLEIVLSGPAPYFPSILANAVAYPRRSEPAGAATGGAPLVSNGAYRLTEWRPGAGLTLDRNPAYWDAGHVAVPRIEYVPIADSATEYLRYRAGALDVTGSVPAPEFAALRRDLSRELQVAPQLAVVYYTFNLDSPPFRDAPGLREALSLVVDRERLTEGVLLAGQVPAYGFVPPGIGRYARAEYPWRKDPVTNRLARARALYQSAGYSREKPLRIRLLCPEDDSLRKVALAATAMWREALGVEVTPVFLEYRSFLSTRAQRGEWEVVSDGWNADYPDPGNFLGIFRSGSPQNDAALADPDFDELLEAAAREPDADRRLAVLARAEARLNGDYAVAPLYYVVTRRLVKPRVLGATLSPMNHNYSRYLALDATAPAGR